MSANQWFQCARWDSMNGRFIQFNMCPIFIDFINYIISKSIIAFEYISAGHNRFLFCSSFIFDFECFLAKNGIAQLKTKADRIKSKCHFRKTMHDNKCKQLTYMCIRYRLWRIRKNWFLVDSRPAEDTLLPSKLIQVELFERTLLSQISLKTKNNIYFLNSQRTFSFHLTWNSFEIKHLQSTTSFLSDELVQNQQLIVTSNVLGIRFRVSFSMVWTKLTKTAIPKKREINQKIRTK